MMIILLALLSPIIVMVGIYFLERRIKRIREKQATYLHPINQPEFDEKIAKRDGLSLGRKSSVDDRLIDLNKKWNDPMV